MNTPEAVRIARRLDSDEATLGEKSRLAVWTTHHAVRAALGSNRSMKSIEKVSRRED